MIDDSDGDFALLASLGMPGVGGLILAILAIVFYVIASRNAADCAKQACPHGGTPKLLDHQCICTEAPVAP